MVGGLAITERKLQPCHQWVVLSIIASSPCEMFLVAGAVLAVADVNDFPDDVVPAIASFLWIGSHKHRNRFRQDDGKVFRDCH